MSKIDMSFDGGGGGRYRAKSEILYNPTVQEFAYFTVDAPIKFVTITTTHTMTGLYSIRTDEDSNVYTSYYLGGAPHMDELTIGGVGDCIVINGNTVGYKTYDSNFNNNSIITAYY